MITHETLKIYDRYNGDVDIFSRAASAKERAIISEHHWATIDQLVHQLTLLDRGLVNPDYAKQIAHNLNSQLAEPSMVTELRRFIAEK